MGLDMYLYSDKHGEVIYWRKANAIHKYFEYVLTGDEELENCQDYKVTRADLNELLRRCLEVKSSLDASAKTKVRVEVGFHHDDNGQLIPTYVDEERYTNTEVAEELLPPVDGFFFGSVVIGEYYYQDLIYTINKLNKILNDPEYLEDTFIYHAWW